MQEATVGEFPSRSGRLLRLLARVATLRGEGKGVARSLRRVETLPLGPKQYLVLVECDGERFLLASSGDGLSAPVPLIQRFASPVGETR